MAGRGFRGCGKTPAASAGDKLMTEAPCPIFLGRASSVAAVRQTSVLRLSGRVSPLPAGAAAAPWLPRARLRSPRPQKPARAAAAGSRRVRCLTRQPSRRSCVRFETCAVSVAVHVAPHAASEFAEGHGGDLVDAVPVLAREDVLGRGQRWVGDVWGVIADVIGVPLVVLSFAEQTREDKPNISQITSESGVSGKNRL